MSAQAPSSTSITPALPLRADYLPQLGATPVLYGEGVVARVQAAAGAPVDAVFDVAGKTPAKDLVSLAPRPSQVRTIANFNAAQAGVQVSGGRISQSGHVRGKLVLVPRPGGGPSTVG